MSAPLFQIRLWNADNTGWRPVALKQVAATPSWHLTRDLGYADASLTLWGRPSDISGLAQRRRIEFFARETETSDWVRLYRGQVARIDPKRGRPRQSVITLQGISVRAGKAVVRQRYAWPYALDAAAAYGTIVARWVKSKPEFASIDIESLATGQTVDSLDAWRRHFSDVVSDLIATTGGATATGADVNPDGLDRLFFRPFGSAAAPEHSVIIPSPRTGGREGLEDVTGIANVLDLVGGAERYGGNLLAQAVGGNTSFEAPAFTGDGSGNLLRDPGFELRDGSWTLSSGASYKAAGGLEGATDGGSWMVEIDNLTEKISQSAIVPAGSWVVGANYILNVRARREETDASVATATVTWKDGGGATVQTDTLVIAPISVVWEDHPLTSKCPAGAANALIEVELTTDAGHGVLLDNLSFYDQSFLYQSGWELHPSGSAVVQAVNWVFPDAKHGAYCIYIRAIASDADYNDVVIRGRGDTHAPVVGDETLRFSIWIKSPAGASAFPKLQLQILEYDSGGGYIGLSRHDRAASGAVADWTQVEFLHTVAANCAGVTAVPVLRGSGEALFDAAMLTDASYPATPFLEGSAYEGVFHASDLFAGGGADAALHDSEADWGELPEILDQTSVMTDTDAGSYAAAYFRSHALPIRNPSLELFGAPAEYWPGQYVRAIGADGLDLLPVPLPIAEVEGAWDGKLSLTLHLVTEKPDEARKIRELVRKAAMSGGAAGGAGAISGGGGGGGVVPGGAATVKVAAADTLADYLGAKLTAGAGVTLTTSTDATTGAQSLELASTATGTFVDRGAYDNATAYAEWDLVDYGGSSYVARGATTGNAPTGVTDTHWQLIARKGDPGADGTDGADSTVPGPTGPGFTWRGAWDSATAYDVRDVVSRSGSSYVAIMSSTAEDPATATAYWSLVAEKGAAGGGLATPTAFTGVISTDTTLSDLTDPWQVWTVGNGANITLPDASANTGKLITLAYADNEGDSAVTVLAGSGDYLALGIADASTNQIQMRHTGETILLLSIDSISSHHWIVIGRFFRATDLGVDATGTTLGTLVKKIQVFDRHGGTIGFLPLYDSIT